MARYNSIANQLRRRHSRPGDTWHMDEVFLAIHGKRHYLWRAVDRDGHALDMLVQRREDKPTVPLALGTRISSKDGATIPYLARDHRHDQGRIRNERAVAHSSLSPVIVSGRVHLPTPEWVAPLDKRGREDTIFRSSGSKGPRLRAGRCVWQQPCREELCDGYAAWLVSAPCGSGSGRRVCSHLLRMRHDREGVF
jgi:hypothetical protein